jgi:carboxyl-terminal processing protease
MPANFIDPAPEASASTDHPPLSPIPLGTEPGPVAAGMRRRRGIGPAIRRALLVLALAGTFGVGVGVGRLELSLAGPGAGNGAVGSPAPGDELGLIREAWDTIHKNYVDAEDLDDKALAYGAIDGMTDAIGDTGHTAFMTPEERAARNAALSGSYVGIGAEVDTAPDGLPVIVGVFRGSPASDAGLTSGDEIVKVDERSTVGVDLDTVISWVRGEAGTPVVLTVKTGADGKERVVRLVRADVQIEPVSWAMVPGTKIADLRLEQFSTGATTKLKTAIEDLRAAGADRLILDVRGNPGGFVNEAIGITSQFLASGAVYRERNAAGEEKSTPVAPGGLATDLPLVVLVDNGSASAAEILAGAVQDAGRGTLVGVRTFGTGTVLGEFPLSDGSALRIGTLEWLTPKGRVIWHEGITPDVIVERPDGVAPIVPDDLRAMTKARVLSLPDPQLAKAIELVAKAS